MEHYERLLDEYMQVTNGAAAGAAAEDGAATGGTGGATGGEDATGGAESEYDILFARLTRGHNATEDEISKLETDINVHDAAHVTTKREDARTHRIESQTKYAKFAGIPVPTQVEGETGATGADGGGDETGAEEEGEVAAAAEGAASGGDGEAVVPASIEEEAGAGLKFRSPYASILGDEKDIR